MSIYWSELTKIIEPYVPGEQPKDRKYIKLNTNESPYPPSPRVIAAIKEAANSDLKLYPDLTAGEFRTVLADYFKLEKDQIFIGNGSDEILAFSFPAFFNPGEYIYFPDITYSFYPVYARLFSVIPAIIPVTDDFSVPVVKFTNPDYGIIIPNPNAPTGKYLPVDRIEYLLQTCKHKVVIIDEAYIDFGGESAIRLINQYPNLLVVHTLSKSRSLAGLRLGYALGHKALIEGLDRIKNSFNSYTVDRLALAGGVAAFKDDVYFRTMRSKIIETRKWITRELSGLNFKIIDSMANFIFITHPKIKANRLFSELKCREILVRYFDKPGINNFLRVTIGSNDEMRIFLDKIKQILESIKY